MRGICPASYIAQVEIMAQQSTEDVKAVVNGFPGRIRTYEWWDQNPLPCRLVTGKCEWWAWGELNSRSSIYEIAALGHYATGPLKIK